ncbi:NAK protein kinase [Sphaeroforma arctica JP610]|uniref:NAK protein kinase n=1 Tax=Sphaeroforma arctica JP610 TaxID=667725 RepID=A0A0L0FRG9_9EUKA|nr:NAK protein kinase [Sphaeroforma arctica JP610]KNC79370.1 NAK protein kinase [Sphaeroforma arctica JP610]|eukprot:XP_014153272.1 NAK protein kinase [Sphaeroforma arctica JP610]
MKKFFRKGSSHNPISTVVQGGSQRSSTAGLSEKDVVEREFCGRSVTVDSLTVTIDRLIAEGGYSYVFECHDVRTRTPYALKRLVLPTDDQSEMDAEVAVLSRLGTRAAGSSGVIEYFGSARIPLKGHANQIECYLLMQYCPRGIIGCMSEGTLQISFVLQCMASMCVALGAMHNLDAPYIHRDIKVENILLDQENRFRLCDFGSATCRVALAGGTGAIAARTQFYATSRTDIEADISKHTTPQYRSPEMVDLYSGQPISEKCDVWALGCVLYKLLYGDTPFGDSTLSIISGHFSFPPQTSATTTTPSQKEKLDQIVAFMLNSNPKTRPDIYAVSNRIHTLLGKANPIRNTRLQKLVEMFPAIDKNRLNLQLMLSRTLESTVSALRGPSPQPSPNSLGLDSGAQRTQSERVHSLSPQATQRGQPPTHARTQSHAPTNTPRVHIQPNTSSDVQRFTGASPGQVGGGPQPQPQFQPMSGASLGGNLYAAGNNSSNSNSSNGSSRTGSQFSHEDSARMGHQRTRSTPMARAYAMGQMGAALPQRPYSPQNASPGGFPPSPGPLSSVPQHMSLGPNMTVNTQPNAGLVSPISPLAGAGPISPMTGATPTTPNGARERPRAKHRVSNTVDFRVTQSADFNTPPTNDPFAPPDLANSPSNLSTRPAQSAAYDPFAI